jgi:hypothetical protein
MGIDDIMTAWRRGEITSDQAGIMLENVDARLTLSDRPFDQEWIDLIEAQLEIEQCDMYPATRSLATSWRLDAAA